MNINDKLNDAISRLGCFNDHRETLTDKNIDELIKAAISHLAKPEIQNNEVDFRVSHSEVEIYVAEKNIRTVNRLYKSSKNIEKSTYVLILFTIILLLIEIIKMVNGN